MEGRGGGTRDPTWIADVDDDGVHIGDCGPRCERGSQGADTDWLEETALDPISKLGVPDAGSRSLPTRERTVLTCRFRREPAVPVRHVVKSTGGRPCHQHPTFCVSAQNPRSFCVLTQNEQELGQTWAGRLSLIQVSRAGPDSKLVIRA